MQKAWAAGFGAVVAVSAPSSLAVDGRALAGMTLSGSPAATPVANVYTPDAAALMGLPRAAHRLAPAGLGRAGGPTASASRSPTTTATWPRWRGPTGATRLRLEVLTKGVCDGCALGVAGLHDWTIDGVHLCTTRLHLLELNTADAFDPAAARRRRRRCGAQRRRSCGRSAGSATRCAGGAASPGSAASRGTRRSACSPAALRATAPERVALYLTSRGITNEVYYVAGKAARAMGVANVDSAARVCHAPSTVGLKADDRRGRHHLLAPGRDRERPRRAVGRQPGQQPAGVHEVPLPGQARGCRVVVVNPYLEPGLERYWVPSNVESALFGTKMCDLHVPVRPGGDVALANAVAQAC